MRPIARRESRVTARAVYFSTLDTASLLERLLVYKAMKDNEIDRLAVERVLRYREKGHP